MKEQCQVLQKFCDHILKHTCGKYMVRYHWHSNVIVHTYHHHQQSVDLHHAPKEHGQFHSHCIELLYAELSVNKINEKTKYALCTHEKFKQLAYTVYIYSHYYWKA